MDKRTLAATATTLAHLSFAQENAQIDDLNAEIAQIREAMARAESRRADVRRALAIKSGPDAKAIADALLDGASATAAASAGPTEAELRAEQESLLAGVVDLRSREANARRSIAAIREKVAEQVANCMKPMVDAITNEMCSAAESLIDGFAAVTALNELTRRHTHIALAARQAVAGVMGTDKLLKHRRSAQVPREVRDALLTIDRLGQAMPARILESVSLP